MKKTLYLPSALVMLLLSFFVCGNFCASAQTTKEISQVDTISVMSAKMGKNIKNVVIVPDQYNDPELQDEQYPVVYLLHGYGGRYDSWLTLKPELEDAASEYSIIIVCPDGEASWYWDSPINPKSQYETYIIKELVPYIDNNYRTIPDPSMRAITGLSMGGHGGLWLGFRHPDVFKCCGSMSGGVNIIPFPNNWKMKLSIGEYESNKAVWESHTVINLVPAINKAAGQKIIFDCGVDDFFYKVNKELHETLLKAGIPHDYSERPGKHNAPYWRNSIDYHLMYFVKAFNNE